MDGAKLTSGRNKTVNFRNVILIMTTNAGAADASKGRPGFGSEDFDSDAQMEAINRMFSPEFRNRLDRIVIFGSLSKDLMLPIVDKFLNQLQVLLDDKGVILHISEEAKEWLADKGFSEKFGARPLARFIQEKVKLPLVDEILFGKLKNGGTANGDLADNGKEIEYEFDTD
jgi:ATP-dependent Clp protease ATP-binding subunit ClpA